MQLVLQKEIEISIHSYGLYNRSLIGGSYSIFGVDWCLMVPIQKEIPRYMYPVLPLKWGVWILLLFSVVYIGLVLNVFDWILHDQRRWRRGGRFGEGVLNAVAFMVNIPATYRLDSAHWKHITGVYIFLMIFGFVLSNYYTTLLASFLTTTVFKDNLNTIDHLVASGINIMAQDFDAEKLFPENTSHDSDKIRKILKVVSPAVYNQHRNNFNQSFAYPLSSDKWQFLAKQQKLSQRPLFRYSNICFLANIPITFLMEYDSHLQESLNDFILKVYASGLVYYWVERDFELAVLMGEMQRFRNLVTVSPITLETLIIVWMVLGVGLALSAIAFMLKFLLGVEKEKKV